MAARKTTVTHPDGTVSTRSSKTMTYTHAVEIGPADPERVAAGHDRDAAEFEAKADKLEAALADKPQMRIKSRGIGPGTASHVASLVGTDVYTWCDADQMTRHGYPEQVVEPVGPYLLARAREYVTDYRDQAAKYRGFAADVRAAGTVAGSDGRWGVYRWSTRADLAHKALAEAARYHGPRGCEIRVVTVDA